MPSSPSSSHRRGGISRLAALARLIRFESLAMTTTAGSGHVTSSLSATDLMTVLWFDGWFRFAPDRPDHPNNDRLIFSKGHASPLYYALWFAAGRLSAEDLRGYRQFGSPLEGHPTAAFPYADAATGSLGQGLAIGAGFALNARHIDRLPYRTYVLLGDSEMAEGSQWEAIQLAAHYRLGNLIGILDVNRLGQRGETMFGHDTGAYVRRLEAFGWRTREVDGHDLAAIHDAYTHIDESSDAPLMIIARTVKGKGVPSLEDQEGKHGQALDEKAFAAAVKELGDVDLMLRGKLCRPENITSPNRPTQPATPTAYEKGEKVATREAYGRALRSLYDRYPDIVALDGEVSNSTKSELFHDAHPDRFFEMFIAEQAMVGVAIGLARRGRIPFVSTFAAFLTRAFDQLRLAPYSEANVKLVGSHAGVSIGEDGPSQMGLEDIAMFRSIPGCVVLHPCDAVSTEKLVGVAARHRGLVYLRTMRQETPVIYEPGEEFEPGGSKILRESPHDVAVIIAAGATVFSALEASDHLAAQGFPVGVIDLYSIVPIDTLRLTEMAARTRVIVTVEDHYAAGGLGEAVKSALAALAVPVFSLAVDMKPRSGDPATLQQAAGISAEAIAKTIHRALGQEPVRSTSTPDAVAPKARASSHPATTMNPLRQLTALGQSVWLDSLSRSLLTGGRLRRLIQEDGVTGITSNPAIFDEAITRSNDYDDAIRAAHEETEDPEKIFERLAIADIQGAADELQPAFLASGGCDGFVSLEVSPRLAHDTEASVRRGRELWRAVSRPNLFIKIPGTAAGLPAIRRLLAEGINVNVTLLFSLARYRDVIDAYRAGAGAAQREGHAPARLTSVASFFLSRIDTLIDEHLDTIIAKGGKPAARARELRGTVAIACARQAYALHREVFAGEKSDGPPPQRLLWASTSTKDPAYPDLKYVEPLIGPDTITTLPLKTLNAYRDHGDPRVRLTDDLEHARATLRSLEELGIDLDALTRQLETEGIDKFATPYQRMLEHLESKVAQLLA